MNKHYILTVDPQADHEWDRCIIRNPMTGERPRLDLMIANAVSNRAGSYLVRVDINVEILEQTVSQPSPTSLTPQIKNPAQLLSVTSN